MPEQSEVLDDALEVLCDTGPEFGPGLSNHGPMAAEALYTLGRVSHWGTFAELEDQMCLMTAGGYEGEGSPDRVDALVWAFTELFPAMVTKVEGDDEPEWYNQAGHDGRSAQGGY